MKPKKQPNGAKKRARVRLMFSGPNHATDNISCLHHKPYVDEWSDCVFPVVCIKMPTKRAALAKKKWEGLSYGRKFYEIGKEIARLELGVPSLSDAGFKGMKSARIVGCLRKAEALLALTGEPSP